MKILLLIFFVTLIISCEFRKAQQDFINNFDLKLKGKVINVQQNKYGQKLVCLEVIQSNYTNYFQIHDPNKYLKNESGWENRFFIKVENQMAVFIFDDEPSYRSINNQIVKGATITINENDNKSYRVYDSTQEEKIGGLKIRTLPIRDNII